MAIVKNIITYNNRRCSMSIIIMFRKCEHCRKRYMYNPSTGNFGMVCPKCKKVQSSIIPVNILLNNMPKDVL